MTGAYIQQTNRDHAINPCIGIVNPVDDDILCGTGFEVWHHPGNARFRKILQAYSSAYTAAPTRVHKIDVVTAIVRSITNVVPATSSTGRVPRYLKKHPIFNTWYVAPQQKKVARDKVTYGLREIMQSQKKYMDDPVTITGCGGDEALVDEEYIRRAASFQLACARKELDISKKQSSLELQCASPPSCSFSNTDNDIDKHYINMAMPTFHLTHQAVAPFPAFTHQSHPVQQNKNMQHSGVCSHKTDSIESCEMASLTKTSSAIHKLTSTHQVLHHNSESFVSLSSKESCDDTEQEYDDDLLLQLSMRIASPWPEVFSDDDDTTKWFCSPE